jgi:hypothetical protein
MPDSRVTTFKLNETACLPIYLAVHLRCGHRLDVRQSLPGASFVVNGAAQAHESALTTASLEMKWLNGWSAAATFEGEFSNVTESYAGKGVVRYAW